MTFSFLPATIVGFLPKHFGAAAPAAWAPTRATTIARPDTAATTHRAYEFNFVRVMSDLPSPRRAGPE